MTDNPLGEDKIYDESRREAFSQASLPREDRASAPSRFSAKDVQLIHESLASVNNFVGRRQNEKIASILMYEISSTGASVYKEMTLRELLQYINRTAADIDDIAERLTIQGASSQRKASISGSVDDINLKASTHSSFCCGKDNTKGHKSSLTTSLHPVPTPGEDTFDAVSELRLRDLRRLDFNFNPNEERSVLVRRHAVLFAMDPMRAVVMTDRLILIVPSGADSLISILDNFMKEWNPPLSGLNDHNTKPRYSVSFEIHAYEALITTVKALEAQEFDATHVILTNVLNVCSQNSLLPIEVQEKMRILKNDLALMTTRVESSKAALRGLTEDNEEMALMNLTCLSSKPKLYAYPLSLEILSRHDEIEELLESYVLDFNSLSVKIENALNQIQNAEELVSLRLDTSRNELLMANTALAVLTASIGFSAYLTGVFGMNLDQTIYLMPVPGGFAGIFCGTFVLIPIVFSLLCAYLKFSNMLPNGLAFQNKPHQTITVN